MASIVPSERLRRELDEIVAGVADEEDPIEAIGRLGARLILQQALEEELTEFLGRERYERRGDPGAHRNGYERVTVKTTAGPLELERPRVRNASALGFCSEIVGKGVARTHALEALVICSFLRGLSVRDVEAALEEAFDTPVVSKSTVSRICADTRERYRAWCGRRLDEHDLVYCFLDAVYLKLRPDDTPAEGVLCAWGMTLEGQKVLLGLQLGSRESEPARFSVYRWVVRCCRGCGLRSGCGGRSWRSSSCNRCASSSWRVGSLARSAGGRRRRWGSVLWS